MWFPDVLVRGYVDEVVISCGPEVIARHTRSYERDDFVYDPIHYLPLLEWKTAALDQAAPLQGWELPEEFGVLRRLLESRMGRRGKREYVQVLPAAGNLLPSSWPFPLYIQSIKLFPYLYTFWKFGRDSVLNRFMGGRRIWHTSTVFSLGEWRTVVGIPSASIKNAGMAIGNRRNPKLRPRFGGI